MKKSQYIIIASLLLVLIFIAIIAAKGLRSDDNVAANNQQSQNGNLQGKAGNDKDSDTDSSNPDGEDTTPDKEDKGDSSGINGAVLYSIKADLDNDDAEEIVEILERKSGSDEEAREGILRIAGKDKTEEITYVKKTAGNQTGLFSSVEMIDFNGDGKKDVFIKIPDAGSSFNVSSFYIFDFSGRRSYSYPGSSDDFNPAALTDGFSFEYAGSGILKVKNAKYEFEATMDLTGNPNLSEDDKVNKVYDRSWIDPVTVDLSEGSGVKPVSEKGEMFVKLTFPVFGQAAVDLIGELDVYISFNERFEPSLRRFELFAFNEGAKQLVGKSKELP